jgi:hypothetical protein
MADGQTRQMSSEAFEALLLEVRDGAQLTLTADFPDESNEEGEQRAAQIEEARAVWHTAEFALAMLNPGRHVPKREALEVATELVDRLGDAKETGGEG